MYPFTSLPHDSKEQILNLIWVERISDEACAVLRKQIENAISEPGYALVTNYEIIWQNIFINQKNRVIDLIHGIGATKESLVNLREQVNTAFQDPIFPIIVSYPVSWKYVEVKNAISRRVVQSHSKEVSDIQDLEEQVNTALNDTSYPIITNYSVTWKEECAVWTS